MGFSRQEYWSGLPLPSPPFPSKEIQFSHPCVGPPASPGRFILEQLIFSLVFYAFDTFEDDGPDLYRMSLSLGLIRGFPWVRFRKEACLFGGNVAEAMLRSLRPAVWGVISVRPSAGDVLLVCMFVSLEYHHFTVFCWPLLHDTTNQR